MNAVLYTRRGCHLCDHALEVLEAHGLRVTSIDIDEHPEYREAFNHSVPVVEMDGRVRFRGRVHPVLLRRLLRRTTRRE